MTYCILDTRVHTLVVTENSRTTLKNNQRPEKLEKIENNKQNSISVSQ